MTLILRECKKCAKIRNATNSTAYLEQLVDVIGYRRLTIIRDIKILYFWSSAQFYSLNDIAL